MKKIILLLCLMMFMVVSAKHYKKYDSNPNATVLVQLNFVDEKGNKAKENNTGIYAVDSISLNKGFTIHTSYFHSVKIEPGIHVINIYHSKGSKYGTINVKYDFKDNETYIIDITADTSSIRTKIRDPKETE